MPFIIPTFNLLCNIAPPVADGIPALPAGPTRIFDQPCALVYGKRVNVASTGGTGFAGIPLQVMNLLLPALTDIRGPQDTTSFDQVEVPAGSGRWYWVAFVDDIGKGWPNEHRTATLFAIPLTWIPPYD